MSKSDYYRRQADLCLQLALAQRDQQAAIRLVELADGLITRAEEADGRRSIAGALDPVARRAQGAFLG